MLYYYLSKSKSGNNIVVHLSNSKNYIEANAYAWSAKAGSYKIGSINAPNSSSRNYFVIVEKYDYNHYDIVKIFNSKSEAKMWVYRKKKDIYPKEYAYNIVYATRNFFIPEAALEDHDYTFRADGCDYVILDRGCIVARVDNLTEAREWIAEAEKELEGYAE